MKKIFLYILMLMIVAISCKKDQNANNGSVNQKTDVKTLILNFKDKLENHLKDGGTYTADSAVWYVEALLNYTYGNASVPCINYQVDTAEITGIETNGNIFTIEQLAVVFDNLEADVLASQPQNTNIIAIDVYSYPSDNFTTFASRTTCATPRTPAYKALTDTAGYWFWGADQGMCGLDYGLYVGLDATDIIENVINGTVGYNDYYTDLEYDGASYWDYYFDPDFPFEIQYLMDRRLFAAYGPWQSVLAFCMSPELISYYCSEEGIPYIIDDLCPFRKQFICCDVEGGATDNGGDELVIHSVYITYGVPHN